MGHAQAVLRSIHGEAIALLGVAATGKVVGLLFTLTIEQRYRNSTSSNIEAVYTFPLPYDATLLDLEVDIGGKTLKGIVVERCAAGAAYEQAIDKGNTAIMLERAGNGLLTANFGNVMPGEEARLRYSYAQLLRFDQDGARLTVPTVIAPRYGDPAEAGLQSHQVPINDLTVAYPFTLSIELRGSIGAASISSPTHRIDVRRSHGDVLVTFDSPALLDRDFVLCIGDVARQSLAVFECDEDECVALASFHIDAPEAAATSPLRLKLLLDCSGSMAGDSIAAARDALHRIFAGLTPEHRFSFSRFGSDVVHETDGIVSARPMNLHRIARRLGIVQADLGGTEMTRALRSVFAIGGAEPADVLVISDGEMWAVDALVAEARGANQRVFVVGVGSAPAGHALRRLADMTGGACEFVAPGEDATAAIVRMFDRMRAPQVTAADVVWPATPSWQMTPPHAVFLGETVHVFAGFPEAPHGSANLKLGSVHHASCAIRAPLTTAAPGRSVLARVAANARLQTADHESRLALALRYSLLSDRDAAPAVVRRGRFSPRQDALASPESIKAFLRALDRTITRVGTLPATFDDLERLGLPAPLLDALRGLIQSGHSEDDIVRAFIGELRTVASRFGAGRHLLRALRRSASAQVCAPDLEAAVAALITRVYMTDMTEFSTVPAFLRNHAT